jgi:hypothetical protein
MCLKLNMTIPIVIGPGVLCSMVWMELVCSCMATRRCCRMLCPRRSTVYLTFRVVLKAKCSETCEKFSIVGTKLLFILEFYPLLFGLFRRIKYIQLALMSYAPSNGTCCCDEMIFFLVDLILYLLIDILSGYILVSWNSNHDVHRFNLQPYKLEGCYGSSQKIHWFSCIKQSSKVMYLFRPAKLCLLMQIT